MRPYARGSGGSNDSTVAVAPDWRCSSTSCCSRAEVSRGWSPETTRSSRTSPTLPRAARSESPVPSGRCWTATSIPSKACTVAGATTSTSGSGPSGWTAATTQSTRRRPSSGWRCFGVADFIRVPRPAAMMTAARSLIATGAPGFEPGIAGPKPAALPLGYAPPPGKGKSCLCAPVIRKEVGEGGDGDDGDDPDRDPLEDEGEQHHEESHRLRRGCDPREMPPDVPLHRPSREDVEGEHDHADHQHGPAREIVRDRDDDALDDGGPEGELQPPLAQPTAAARAPRLDHRLRCGHKSTVPRWCRQPGARPGIEAALRGTRALGVQEQPVDGGTGAGDVGAERTQRTQLVCKR